MNISITCTGCSKPFTNTNLPRISTRCYHTYCEYCLTRLHACPMDREPFDFGCGFSEFPVNRSLAKLMGLKMPTEQPPATTAEDKDKENDMCLLHGKEADLMCIDHSIRICSSCALFGEHKQHRIKTIDNVIEECTQVAEHTVAIMAEIQNIQQKTSPNTMNMLMEQAFRDRRDTLSKVIRAKFFRVQERLKKAQDAALQQLDDILTQQKLQVKKSFKPEDIAVKRKHWFRDAEALGIIVDNICCRKKIEEATCYLDDRQEESRIARRGQSLIIDMNSNERMFFDRISEVLADISEQTDTEFQNLIGEYCKIFKASDRNCPVEVIPPRTERQDDDFLLDELNGTQSNESADSCEMPSQQGSAISSISNISCSENLVDIPTLTMDRLDISTPSFVIDKSERCFDDRSFIKEKEPLGQIHNNPDNRKKKKLKIPEKYETIVEDLRCDRSDCIDLTNAQLGDALVVQLCDYIRNSTKMRTLKLIRNKISDEAFGHIIEACSESKLTSLNLGQNLLTDKALDILAKCQLKDLRNLTLSQNRINQRNCKNRVVDFKKIGITISI